MSVVPQRDRQELPAGSTAVIAIGLSHDERGLLGAFIDDLEAATGVSVIHALSAESGLGKLTALRGRRTACVGLVSSALGEREVLRALRWFGAPDRLVPVVVIGSRSDERFLAEVLAARACDVIQRSEIDLDRLARAIRIAAELARRDQAEEAVRQRARDVDEILDAVWDAVEEGLMIVAGDGTIRRFNPAARRLLECAGRPLAETPFSALGWISCDQDLQSAAGFASDFSAELERTEGERRAVGVRVRPLGRRAGAGDVHRLVAVRSRVEPLEAAMLGAEARQFAGLGRFLTAAAHDCGNLLTPLLGYCELLLAKLPEDSPVAGYAEEIDRSARLAAELVHRLRDMARHDPLAGASVSPDRCLLDLAGLLRSLVGRGIEVREELRAGDARIAVHAGEVEQLVLNLAANARDAMPVGGRLTLRTRAEGDRRWILEIEDSGGGIAPENLKRLFDPAFTTKAVGKGTGLGLWIVRSIVERAGGTVEVRSALGRGTTVEVAIPLLRQQRVAAPAV